jgi:dienelactone hydrolase
VRRIVEAPGTCGYHVTVVDGHRRDARVVERSATRVQVRRPVDGVLWGCDPTAGACFDGACDARLPRADGSSVERYAASRAGATPSLGRLDARRAADELTSARGVANDGTLFACAFEPQTGRFWTATRRDAEPDPTTGLLRWTARDLFALLGRDAKVAWAPHDVDGAGVVEGRPLSLGTVERIPLTFPSALPSGVARNDAVSAALFLPKGRAVIGAVVHLPAWRERDLAAESFVAAGLASQGFAVVLLPLPWQAGRAKDGVPPGEWTLSADLARTREAWRQGLADVLRVSHWLEDARGFAPARQAVFGISLGGHVAAIALGAYPERFRAGAFVLAGGGLAKVLDAKEVHLQEAARAMRAKGVTGDDLVGVLDPANWANADRRDDVFLVGARADEIVPASNVEILAAAWGGAHVLWLEGSHMGALREAPRILEGVVAHLKARLSLPR